MELGDRPTSQEMCALLDYKAGVEEVNRTLADISRDLEARVSQEEFSRVRHQP